MTEAVHPLENSDGLAAWLVAQSQDQSKPPSARRRALKVLADHHDPEIVARAKLDWVAAHGAFTEPPPRKRRSK